MMFCHPCRYSPHVQCLKPCSPQVQHFRPRQVFPNRPFTPSPLHLFTRTLLHFFTQPPICIVLLLNLRQMVCALGTTQRYIQGLLAYRKAANCCNKSKMSCHALHEQRYIRLDHAQLPAQRSEKATCGSDIKVQDARALPLPTA